jgi:hypothetical protein
MRTVLAGQELGRLAKRIKAELRRLCDRISAFAATADVLDHHNEMI